MIDRVTGNKALPESIRRDIIERTDGIPLFVEEITKAVLEAENEGAAESAVAAIPSLSVAVPASLHVVSCHASEYRLLSRELSEAREQQAATSEVLIPLFGLSPTNRSHWWRTSPPKPSSPSRTRGC